MKSLLLIFLLAACGSNPVDIAPDAYVYDCPEEDTHSWNGFHWATDNLTIEVVDKTGHEDYLVKDVVDDWDGLGIPHSLIYTREASGDLPTIIVRAQPGDGWLGLARVELVNGTCPLVIWECIYLNIHKGCKPLQFLFWNRFKNLG